MENNITKNNRKKILILVLVTLAVAILAIMAVKSVNNAKGEEAIEEWKSTAIVNPEAGSLKAAGYIDITLKSAAKVYESNKKFGSIKEYKLYVNEEEVGSVPQNEFKEEESTTKVQQVGMIIDKGDDEAEEKDDIAILEYYATKTAGYDAYVELTFENGTVIYSDVFTFYVNKKGMCVNKIMGRHVDAEGMNASWYYNWDASPFGFSAYQKLEYVPMMWTINDKGSKTIQRMADNGYKYALMYNEPDLAEQSNLTVETVIDSWGEYNDIDINLGSPATALCPPWSDEWFQPYMKEMEANNYDVDFIAVHHYWNWYTEEGVEAFLELMDETYEMYGKPIWITEFALDGDPGNNQEQLDSCMNYMLGLIEGLEERDYIQRYAWFSFGVMDKRNAAAALFKKSTGELTALGEAYANAGNPEGYGDENVQNIVKNEKKDKIIK